MTPTQLSLKHLRTEGYTCAVVERWNQYARIRQDLYGCIDILAIRPGATLAVQTTAAPHASERLKKMEGLESVLTMILAGWRVVVHEWGKRGARGKRKTWTLREIQVHRGETL